MSISRSRNHPSHFLSVWAVVAILLATWWGGNLAHARQPDPTATPVVPGLPVGVEVVVSADLALAAGDYQWRVENLTTSMPEEVPLTVDQGLLFASAGPVLVSHEGAFVEEVTDGQAVLIEKGQAISPMGISDTPTTFSLIELWAVPPQGTPEPTVGPGSTSLVTFSPPGTMAQGKVVMALLHLPASDQNHGLVETIVGMAIGPVIDVVPTGSMATPDDSARECWIVALFAPDVAKVDQGSSSDSPTATATDTPTPTATSTPTMTPTATMAATMTPVPTSPPAGSGGGTTLDPSKPVLSLQDDDGDGLTNDAELVYGTDPENPDCDGDGLLDGAEVDQYDTYPLVSDTDGDFLDDYQEVIIWGTNPRDEDTDSDGVDDYVEIQLGTDPLRP